MKAITIEFDQFREQLDQTLSEIDHGGVIVTRRGKPWFIVHPVSEDLDAESIALAQSPEFWEMISQRRREVGIPWEDAKRELDLD
jgi:hypothetical protein